MGVEKDERKASEYYHLAAEQGNYVAQFNLGMVIPCVLALMPLSTI